MIDMKITKKIIFYINGDWNAKNRIWGSKITDDRGDREADWISSNGFTVLNDGSFTYKNSTSGKKDVLDLSIISMEAKKLVTRWKVHEDLSDDYNFSDHYILECLNKYIENQLN